MEEEEQEVALHKNLDDRNVGMSINSKLCGEIIGINRNTAHIRFVPNEEMVVDSRLIHSGFVFSSAAFAAITALNKKNSMIIGADVKFLAPVELGHEIIFKANALQDDTKRCEIKVEGFLLDIKIFYAIFSIAVFDKKIFKLKFNDE